MNKLLVVIGVIPLLVALLLSRVLFPERVQLNTAINITNTRYWGDGDKPEKLSEEIRPFKIQVPDEVLEDLKQRLARTRYFEPITGSPDDYGLNPSFSKDIIEYWKNSYDWRKQEQFLNQYDQFITNIDGIDVHFLHVKAKRPSNNAQFSAKPLILIHGWPGSFYEFYQILPLLVDPGSHGGNNSIGYDVVIPSIPGYGFSSSPKKRGFDQFECGLLFAKLMLRLGYNRYMVQGGDWGGIIGTAIAGLNPENCAGLHINFATPHISPWEGVKYLVAHIFPDLIFSKEDQERALPLTRLLDYVFREMGYFHEQATRPYTLGHGLSDSPVGLAAWILEKFTVWSDCKGDPYNRFTKDQLLTNVMIYWVTNTISSSVKFYKEFWDSPYQHVWEQAPIYVPTGVLDMPKEIFTLPRSWIASRYLNIVSYTKSEKGGHFAAMEEPRFMAEDLWRFHQLIDL